MGDIALRVENLTKEYRLGTIGYGTMREDLQSWWARVRGKEDPNSLVTSVHSQESDKKHFLALDDISFEVKKGDRIGIIGKNGAGKSTLLKILSRITSPTKGNIYINGRIGSLLEVGTGFHPELTGRENIYLNGAILGMKRWEITNKLDEIVNFAGIERFIDTPVKRYSSGMFVRLGFAVAAHLEPDILIVDEVLAVGDLEFQKRAIGKMQDVSQQDGRTILFVSHNMTSINSLCDKSILLSSGNLVKHDETAKVIQEYQKLSGYISQSAVDYTVLDTKIGNDYCELMSAEVVSGEGKNVNEILIGDQITIKMQFKTLINDDIKLVPNFHFFTSDGSYAFVDNAPNVENSSEGIYVAECNIPKNLLNEGIYIVGLAITAYAPNMVDICFFEKEALSFLVRDPMDENSNRYGYTGRIPGAVRPKLKWEIKSLK